MTGERSPSGSGASEALLQLASFFAGVPIAVVVLIVGSSMGLMGAVVAAIALLAGAAAAARGGLLLLAAGLLVGLVGCLGLVWLLEAVRPDY